KTIFCSAIEESGVVTSTDYKRKEMTKPVSKSKDDESEDTKANPDSDTEANPETEPVYRSVNVFKCSKDLSDFADGVAQPYFLAVGADKKPAIIQPKFSTFDNAVYLLGRSLRPGFDEDGNTKKGSNLDSKFETEERFCGLLETDSDCKRNTSMFRIHSAKDSPGNLFDKCASSFIAEVEYKGTVYRAGLPEKHDSNTDDCHEDTMTATTLILLSKIVEYSIQRPEINTQLLITQ
ncbi:MAG: hypothetical protein AAGL11_08395, partial [Pseudomonadota bacterium]